MRIPVMRIAGWAAVGLGLSISASLLAQPRQVSEVRPPSASEYLRSGVHASEPLLSIGEVIDESEVIVRARLVDIEAPYWNSVDGTNWAAESEPIYDQVPIGPRVYTAVAVRVEEVLDGDPALSGAILEVHYLGSPGFLPLHVELAPDPGAGIANLGPVILFLHEDDLWLAGPTGARLPGKSTDEWQSPGNQGRWWVDPSGLVYPAAQEQGYSLRQAVSEGAFEAEPIGHRAGISVEDLLAIIDAERQTPNAASFASFTEWPWEPIFNTEVQHGVEDVPPDRSDEPLS